MVKAFLLLAGTVAYLAATHFAYDTATAQTQDLKKFYTSTIAQANDISAANR